MSTETGIRVRMLLITALTSGVFAITIIMRAHVILTIMAGISAAMGVVAVLGDWLIVYLYTCRLHSVARWQHWLGYCYGGEGTSLIELARRSLEHSRQQTLLDTFVLEYLCVVLRPSSTMIKESHAAEAKYLQRRKQERAEKEQYVRFIRALRKQVKKLLEGELFSLLPQAVRWQSAAELEDRIIHQDWDFLQALQRAIQQASELETIWRQAQRLGVESGFLQLVLEDRPQAARQLVASQQDIMDLRARVKELGCQVPPNASAATLQQIIGFAERRRTRQADVDAMLRLIERRKLHTYLADVDRLSREMDNLSERDWRIAAHDLNKVLTGG